MAQSIPAERVGGSLGINLYTHTYVHILSPEINIMDLNHNTLDDDVCIMFG